MRYQVRFVDDGALPEGHEFAFVRSGGISYLFMKESAIDVDTGRCDALARAWAVYQAAAVVDREKVS